MMSLLAVVVNSDFSIPEIGEQTVGTIAVGVILSNWCIFLGTIAITLFR